MSPFPALAPQKSRLGVLLDHLAAIDDPRDVRRIAHLSFLAAQVGMAAFSQAFTFWLDGDPGDLDEHLAKAFREVSNLIM